MSAPLILQGWPAAMDQRTACLYCSTTADRLPPPAYRDGKSPRWTREQLEEWISERAGVRADAWERAAS
jgi:hypothetical protein